ncbi:MAG: QacE family quaternary ammonium compound efflux SMR transporter [Chloroflexi bacterium AL-W]|nr:QacE family quaternary ammonium compound efflux SMR transporter [Chloroflexi bacterium AL-N1]NOK69069.1 QacE family quaternary ammonium compound efflux SMR transporter [Chloroflexi bacterium AL-N10]NOK77052.1 QacE family quaternary ammonium compound efflux SMR transporter [Chloroflexi bacterium AL-N5]NOK83697.1 QacE family quaternary ammonium compound efflux SMR transporter [Chloroflexi bacterium AL-W]NOK90907.1 QacE family quaternary ammonium compound efflux SMR transporter [Chloroflexi bac
MHIWLLLSLAIGSEIIATTALKASDGFTRSGPIAIMVLGYGVSFYLIGRVLEHLPVGTVYAIWSGVGTAGIALIGVWFFNESLNMPRVLGIVLIIAGVVVLNMFSNTPT